MLVRKGVFRVYKVWNEQRIWCLNVRGLGCYLTRLVSVFVTKICKLRRESDRGAKAVLKLCFL